MPIYAFFIMNKNAGMVYAKDFSSAKSDVEKTFNYPLELKLDKSGCIKFGAKDQIRNGQLLLAINGQSVYFDKEDESKLKIEDLRGAKDIFQYLETSTNFPVQLKFGKPPLTTNDKLVLTGRFFG